MINLLNIYLNFTNICSTNKTTVNIIKLKKIEIKLNNTTTNRITEANIYIYEKNLLTNTSEYICNNPITKKIAIEVNPIVFKVYSLIF